MADRFFVVGVDADWDDTGNWAAASGGAGGAGVPTAADNAIFDINSPNCNLDVNAVCLKLDLQVTFAAILDLVTFDLDIGVSGLTMAAGTFDLGTGTWNVDGSVLVTGGAIVKGTSTTALTPTTSRDWDFNGETLNILTVNFSTTGATGNFTGTVIVDGAFDMTDWGTANRFRGTVTARGDVIAASDVIATNATEGIIINGGANQDVFRDQAGGTGYLPGIIINSTGGTVTFFDTLRSYGGGGWLYTAGTVDMGTSRIDIGGTGTYVLDSAGMSFFDLGNLKIGGSLNTIVGVNVILNDLFLDGTNLRMNGGTLQVGRNISSDDPAGVAGTTIIELNGTGAQSIDLDGGDIPDGNFIINKASGTAALISPFNPPTWTGSLIVTLGILDLAGFAVTGVGVMTVTDTLHLQGPEAVAVGLVTLGAASTVVYSDAAATVILNDLATAFNNLTFGAGKTHQVAAATVITISGILLSNGTAANRSLLRSTINGTQGQFNLSGASWLADNMNVRDNDASPGNLIVATGSLNSGNNLNWDFGPGSGGGNQIHARGTRLYASVGGTVGDLFGQGFCGVAQNDAALGAAAGGAGGGGGGGAPAFGNMIVAGANEVPASDTPTIGGSPDAGVTWTSVFATIPTGVGDTFKACLQVGNFFYAILDTAGLDLGCYRSSNGQTGWTLVSTLTGTSNAALDEQRNFWTDSAGILYLLAADNISGDNHVWRSADQGVTWVEGTNAVPVGATDTATNIFVTSADTLLAMVQDSAANADKIYRSLDKGDTWVLEFTFAAWAFKNGVFAQATAGGRIICALGDGTAVFFKLRVVKSDDDGLTWQDLGATVGTNFVVPASIIGTHAGNFLITDTGVGIDIWRSVDNGLTWAVAQNIPTAGGPGIKPFRRTVPGRNTYYLPFTVGGVGRVWFSINETVWVLLGGIPFFSAVESIAGGLSLAEENRY